MSLGACRIFQKLYVFRGSDRGEATFFESPRKGRTIESCGPVPDPVHSESLVHRTDILWLLSKEILSRVIILTYPFPQIQRKLQLRIEEQGKYLEMMFERTKDIGKDFKVSSSITDEHPSPSTEPKHSPPNDKSEALEKDPVSLNDRSITGQESS